MSRTPFRLALYTALGLALATTSLAATEKTKPQVRAEARGHAARHPGAAPRSPPTCATASSRSCRASQPDEVAVSPVPGLYEVTMGGLIAYVSADGKYLLSGNVYDLDTQVNLTATRRNTARAKALAGVSESQMIVFGPPNAKMTVTVFTDIDCGYCRKFHSQIAEVNKAGVRVRYMMFPRTGPGTESWEQGRAGLVFRGPARRAHARQEGRDAEVAQVR